MKNQTILLLVLVYNSVSVIGKPIVVSQSFSCKFLQHQEKGILGHQRFCILCKILNILKNSVALFGCFGKTGAKTVVSKILKVNPHYKLKIKVPWAMIDFWDNQAAQIKVENWLWKENSNGMKIILVRFVVVLTEVDIDHTGDQAKIEFTTTLDEVPNNESIGLRDQYMLNVQDLKNLIARVILFYINLIVKIIGFGQSNMLSITKFHPFRVIIFGRQIYRKQYMGSQLKQRRKIINQCSCKSMVGGIDIMGVNVNIQFQNKKQRSTASYNTNNIFIYIQLYKMQANPALHTPAKKNCTFEVEGRPDGEGYLSQNNAMFGIIVIQEWWGLNESMVKTTDKIAKMGFQCISPDIYRGKVAQNREEAGHLLVGLDWEGAVKDIEGAAKHLREMGCKKVGVTGFCMGGALAIAALSFSDQINASAPFYGVCDLNTFKLDNIKGPIYGQFGEKDEMKGFSSPADAQRLVDAGQKAGKNVKVKIWPGVGHAFTNQDRPETYNAEVAQQALQEVATWFKQVFSQQL